MKILEKLKEVFAKGPQKEHKQSKKEKKQDQPEIHHHNHGSSTT